MASTASNTPVPDRSTHLARAALTAGLVAGGVLLGTLASSGTAAAAYLDVTASPIQTWTQHDLPELPQASPPAAPAVAPLEAEVPPELPEPGLPQELPQEPMSMEPAPSF